ncbi:MAG: tetratricopeptide repeat protein, partial [Methanocorpusculum sp.]|nr:tetratricopeptide repeat protein [Methanocorpusculum sp.]
MSAADDFFKKGLAAYSVRDFSSAEKFFSSALCENPKNANYFYYRGECFSELGKTAEAIDDYSKALEICP